MSDSLLVLSREETGKEKQRKANEEFGAIPKRKIKMTTEKHYQ